MQIDFRTCYSLPCYAEVFTINGIDAEIDDFGYSSIYNQRWRDSELDQYGCRGREWHIDNTKLDDACEKYGISESEFFDIGEMLETKLSIGNCGWCI